jgi:hypothetical protein
MTAASDDLHALERAFWFGDAQHYRANLTPGCLMVFPGMGVATRNEIVAGVESGPRWATVAFGDWRRHDPRPDVAIVAYRATATRADRSEPHIVLCGSVYVRDGEDWRLAFHQQTLDPPTADG